MDITRRHWLVSAFVASLGWVGALSPAAANAAGEPNSELEYRTWVDSTGQFRIEAAMVSTSDREVLLKRKSDGTEVTVPLNKLSTKDALYVHIEKTRAAKRREKENADKQPAPEKNAANVPAKKAAAVPDDMLIGAWEGSNAGFDAMVSINANGSATCSISGGGVFQVSVMQVQFAKDGRSCVFSDGKAVLNKDNQLQFAMQKQVFVGGFSRMMTYAFLMRKDAAAARVKKKG